jgi:uncharacterized protein (TIGR00369 family)
MPPSATLLGWQLVEVDPEAGTISVRYHARPDFANPMGNVQGGFVAAMLDEAMGPALVATLPPGQFAPTLEMKISYLEPVKVGPLWAHGRVVKRGSTNAFIEADLVDEAGTLLARASATVRVLAAPGASSGDQ